MNKNKISAIWPTYIGEFYNPDHDKIKLDLLNYFEQYKKEHPNLRNGVSVVSPKDKILNNKIEIDQDIYVSNKNLHKENNESYSQLMMFFSKALISIATKANENEKMIKDFDNKKLESLIMDSWFIDYKNEGGLVLPHIHSNCSWCGVYIVQANYNSESYNGSTFFHDIRPTSQTNDFGSLFNSKKIFKIKPIEGKLLIWPQYVMHGSLPYEGDKNRIIVSFNAKVNLKD